MRGRPTDAPAFLEMRCECGLTRREHVGPAEDHAFEPAATWAQRREHDGRGRIDGKVRGTKGVI